VSKKLRRCCCALVLSVFSILALAARPSPGQGPEKNQQPKVAQVFAQREQTASPEIKQLLSKLRGRVAESKFAFSVGYTAALDKKLETLAGTRAPENLKTLAEKQNDLASQMLKIDEEARAEYLKAHPGALSELKFWQEPAPCV